MDNFRARRCGFISVGVGEGRGGSKEVENYCRACGAEHVSRECAGKRRRIRSPGENHKESVSPRRYRNRKRTLGTPYRGDRMNFPGFRSKIM